MSHPSCSCAQPGSHLARFLAGHPVLHRGFAAACHSRLADGLAQCIARGILARCRHSKIDYQRLLSSCSCDRPTGDPASDEYLERQFVCGIMDRPVMRRRLTDLLLSLEGLNLRTRIGLLKTWLLGGLATSVLREAELLRRGQVNGQAPQPVDAIVAPFGGCNLRCRGCYTLGELGVPGATPEQLDYVMGQLKAMNVYHVLLVGKGEPFHDTQSRWSLYTAARRHPQVFISVFSNGTLVEASDVRQMRRLPNLIPVFSIDGPEGINDWRRGEGVYRKVIDTCHRMRAAGVLFGYISTVFRQNWKAVLEAEFVRAMAGHGCRLGYYSQFINPGGAAADTQRSNMMLDARERTEYRCRFAALEAAAAMPLIDLDGIEAHVGCRARFGATVYVDAVTGQVSPCVRAPLESQQCNLYRPAGRDRLAQVLQSEPFRQYRSCRSISRECEVFAGGKAK